MTRTFTRHYEHHETVWNGVKISISYEPRWLSLADDYGLDTAHLEIEAIAPERAPLPITETGYRSHFTTAHAVAAMGGPVALVRTWLDEEAASPAWQREVAAARQLTLF
ncbi:MAG: hypothetical protein KGZ61_05210 [Sandarakinorhabdus sp.]|nr:hypothetical protein [Sandarakinorhabdus sp.]